MSARAILLSVVLAAPIAAATSPDATAQERPDTRVPSAPEHAEERAALAEIARLFREAQLAAVIRRVDDLIARVPISIENVPALFFRAESHWLLGQRDAAIRDYEAALAAVGRLASDDDQSRFAVFHLRLAERLREVKRLDAAQARLEQALRLEPDNAPGQLLRGELLAERGEWERALRHYRELLASTSLASEERAVLGLKVDRLETGVGASVRPPDLRAVPVHVGLSIALVPLNGFPASVSLADVCVILESSWRIRCAVLASLTIPEETIAVAERGQVDAPVMLPELRMRLPGFARGFTHVVGVTGRDMFAPGSPFVFSWQGGDVRGGMAVVSAHRLTTGIPDYYEPAMIATRRVAVQSLWTTGSMLGVPPPSAPDCPMAPASTLRELQGKRLQLCGSDERHRDQLLERMGGPPLPFGEARAEEIARVYRAYYVESDPPRGF